MNLAAEPVDVIDLTGLVVDVRVGTTDGEPVGRVRGRASGSSIHLEWIGGACESRTRIVFGERDAGYAIDVRPETSLGGILGCPAIGILRAIDIDLRSSIEGRRLLTVVDGG